MSDNNFFKNLRAYRQEKKLEKPAGAYMLVPLLIIMAVVVVIMRYGLGIDGYEVAQQPSVSGEELAAQILPTDEQINGLFRIDFGEEAQSGKELSLLTRDSALTAALLTKLRGTEPKPMVIIVHDAPSSRRDTNTVSEQVGQYLTNQLGVVTLTIDWRDSDFGEEDVNDLIGALTFMDRYRSDGSPSWYILGIGHGAYMTAKALEEGEHTMDGVVLVNGYDDLAAEYASRIETGAALGAQFLKETGCDAAEEVDRCLSTRSATPINESVEHLLLTDDEIDEDYVLSPSVLIDITAWLGEETGLPDANL